MRSQGHAQGHGTEVDHVQNGHPNGALLQRGNVRDVGETGGKNGHIRTRQGRWQGGRVDDVLHRPRGHPGIDHYHCGVYKLAHQSHEHWQLSAATIGEGAFMGLISKGNTSNAIAAFPEFMSFLGIIVCIM